MLAMIDQMEMDFCDAYPRNHDKQHYCMRQGLGHEPFGALKVVTSNDIFSLMKKSTESNY